LRLIGGCIAFLAFFGFSQAITPKGILAFCFGIFLMALPELFGLLIHKAKR
jgi:hypothetical protein